MLNPKLNIMKTRLRTLILMPFFALLFFYSCQEEVTDITQPTENEALTADAELTTLIGSTSKMDGSKDNVIDNASCLSVNLPVVVVANGLEITISSVEDYSQIEAIFNEFEDDDDNLEISYPITITLSDYTEVTVENREALVNLIKDCKGENEPDDDIECIDFKYPIYFSVYNLNLQFIDTVTIENDRELFKLILRVKQREILASLKFPVTMEYTDGTETVVNNYIELARTIKDAKELCDEDDDNDYHDDDFTKARLDELLPICPWVVLAIDRNQINLSDQYREYVMVFNENGVVKAHARGGNVLTGTWSTRVTNNGVAIKLTFDALVDFSLEWYVYEIEYGKIKLHTAGGNKIILKKNCDVVFDITKERIENYLQECFWRVERLYVNGAENEKDYIGTPLKFLPNNEVKIRVNGEFVTGSYEVLVRNIGFILQITLEGRPDLKLEWVVTFLEPGLIKLENANNKMVLERHCPDVDGDLIVIDAAIIAGEWEVAKYQVGVVDKTINYAGYSIDFLISGRVKVTDPNNGIINGSWLTYRKEGLYLGMLYENIAPFNVLTHRWKIVAITANRIELKDFSSTGTLESMLVLEKKI